MISPETGASVREAVERANFPREARFTWIEQKVPGGIAHAVKEAREFLGSSLFVLYLGDNLTKQRLDKVVGEFKVTAHTTNNYGGCVFLKQVDKPGIVTGKQYK